jgi:hypothetical protein
MPVILGASMTRVTSLLRRFFLKFNTGFIRDSTCNMVFLCVLSSLPCPGFQNCYLWTCEW